MAPQTSREARGRDKNAHIWLKHNHDEVPRSISYTPIPIHSMKVPVQPLWFRVQKLNVDSRSEIEDRSKT